MDNKQKDNNLINQTIRVQDCYPSEMLDGSSIYSDNSSQVNKGEVNNNSTTNENNTNMLENLLKNLSQGALSSNNLLSNFLSKGSSDMGAILPLISSLAGGANATGGGANILSLLNGLKGKNSTNNVKSTATTSKIDEYEKIEKE